MSTKHETARRAADFARAEEAREKQVGRDLNIKKGATVSSPLAAEHDIQVLQR